MTSEPEKPIPQCLAEQLGMLRTSLQDAANRGAWRHLVATRSHDADTEFVFGVRLCSHIY